ncbi:hypothetical protein [Streptomyces sp. NPDC006640]|uniref:hypothetical protein n=1 Tax=unclassified Streptomyces TaxID=2593676 RepID=UPI0036893B3B
MIIEYTPEGGETQYLDASRLRASEISAIERNADGRWADIKTAASAGDIGAMRVIGFTVKQRTEPALRLKDFDPFEDELRARLDARETRHWAERLFDKYGSDPGDLADAWDELRASASDPEACEQAIADVTAPKDPEPEPSSESPASPSDG